MTLKKPDEIAEDDEYTSLQEMAWCVEAEIAEEDAKEEKPKVCIYELFFLNS